MTDAEATKPEGFELPVHLALTQPVLIAGVPRELGILTLVFALVLILGLHLWLFGLVFGLAAHGAAVALTKVDPYWLLVFRRHLRAPKFLDG